jgi:hypothetical protein
LCHFMRNALKQYLEVPSFHMTCLATSAGTSQRIILALAV